MKSTLKAIRNLWPDTKQEQQRGKQQHRRLGEPIPRIPSFEWARDGAGASFAAAVADEVLLRRVPLPPPEDDDDEVEGFILVQGRTARRHKPMQLFTTLPPLPLVPAETLIVATPPAHLDAIVPSTAILHLAAYLSLPASLSSQDVIEHVLARPNLRAAVGRLRASDADLFNSMPWAAIVHGSHDGDARAGSRTLSPETQQAWGRLHARNAANKHRRRREVVALGGKGREDLFPAERQRDRKRRLTVHGKAWQRGSPRVTGPAALYRVHDDVGAASSDAAPGRWELVDDVLSWTRPGRSKLRQVVVVE